jgi:two-component system, cell cycle response regulator DivK
MAKILYVEDNFQNFRLVMRMLSLEDRSFEVTQAPDGETALRLVGELKPDLILMDINLPDIDGTEVTRRIKATEEFHNIPIVALTANAMVGDQERFMESGCDGYLRKPISRDELRQAVNTYCPVC